MRVHGVNSVYEALKAGKVNKIFVSTSARSRRIDDIVSMAKKAGIPVFYVKNLSSNIEASVSPLNYVDFDFLVDKSLKGSGMIVMLDSVQDPQNLGAVIRNAVFFGCDGIVIPKRRSAQINETVIKASAGSAYHINISRVSNLSNSIKKLKKYGFFVIGAEVDGKSIEEVEVDFPVALVIGGEDEGISNPVKKRCDEVVSIRSCGDVVSMNLACASAVILYELRRRIE